MTGPALVRIQPASARTPGGLEEPARGLALELSRSIEGEVRFDGASRALYSTDGSNYRKVPLGLVVPRHAEDVLETLRACRAHGVSVVGRGGGTSLAGQCCNFGVVLDFSKHMSRILEIDADQRIARVQPGVVLDDLRDAARAHGLTYGPDPSTHAYCTMGGMIANNSCGVHSILSGRAEDNLEELTVATYDGEVMRVGAAGERDIERIVAEGGRRGRIYHELRRLRDDYAGRIREAYPDIPRRVSGYSLPALLPENGFHVARSLAGSEGTCALVLEATVSLIHRHEHRVLLVLGYPDMYLAADAVPRVLEYGPIGLEGFDRLLVEYMSRKGMKGEVRLLPEGAGWLLAEFGANTGEEALELAMRAHAGLLGGSGALSARLSRDPREQKAIWEVRESALGATAVVPGMPHAWEGWEDAAVPPARLGAYLRDFRSLLERYGFEAALYGHFGDGCVHTRIPFDLQSAGGIQRYLEFIDEAADLVISYGGSLSGEHGDGQSRSALLGKMFGEELLGAFRRFKAIWDPENGMNPGNIVDPFRPDEHLRLGADYAPARPETYFSFHEDGFDFSNAALRCVGVGKCRRKNAGTMCPSYMVTREEMHSTRGRAHLLFEMLQGGPVSAGWRDEGVKEALDLCLACKACAGECPVNVDMATYKAEFMAHYYEGRLRPRGAYAMGWIHRWARVASHAPRLVNRIAAAPGFSRAVKWLGGVAPERELPRFARRTFRSWFDARRRDEAGGPHPGGPRPGTRRVLLWPDTFSNHFHPQTAIDAVLVLEEAGFEVALPGRPLCCGRALYDFGMLGLARKLLARVVDTLREDIRSGTPLIGLEPGCVSVFRDEMPNLIPHDEDVDRLARQSFMLGEFIAGHAEHFRLPRLAERALVHGHCHHTSILDFDSERSVLDALGLDYEVLDSGCCGMAGSFGFEPEKYTVSRACGERVLLPAVRSAAEDTMIVTDGFSCREQIRQGSGRDAVHLATLIRMGLEAEGRLLTPRREG